MLIQILYKFLFVFLLFYAGNAFAQSTSISKSKKAQKFYKEALNFSKIGEFDNALNNYDKAIKSDPYFIIAYIKKAQIFKQQGFYLKAINTYKKILEKKIGNNNLDQIYFEIGQMYFLLGKYILSKSFFLKLNNKAFISKADTYLDNIKFSLDKLPDSLLINPKSFEIANIFSLQYFPYFDQVNNMLYFTARKGKSLFDDENLYFIERLSNQTWGNVQSISKIINSDNNEGSISFSSDRKMVIFSFCTSDFKGQSCDLYYSKKSQNKWIVPQKLNNNINTEYWESHPSLSSDGNFLFFSSNRPGGYGGKDIWFVRKEGKEWGRAKNLGDSINTSFNEISPFIHSNMIDFYFASNGKKSFGGYDIYHGIFDKEKVNFISNFGYPVNNHFDQSSFNLSDDGTILFYTSEKYITESVKNSNIYFAEIDSSLLSKDFFYFSGQVLDVETTTPIHASIELKNLLSNESSFIEPDSLSKIFNVLLLKNTKYQFLVSSKGYDYKFFQLEKPNNKFQEIYLNPLKSDLKLNVKKIYFDVDDAKLDFEAKNQLDILSKWLLMNEFIKIEISGHTDDTGTDKHNMDLSERRAKNVYSYLMSNLPSHTNQVSYKAYGNKKPIYKGDDMSMKKLNRRIEFRITNHF